MLRFLLALSFILASTAHAAIIYVPQDVRTIQGGIDRARNGDLVKVAAGTYRERIDFKGKAIRLLGSGTEETVLDASSVQSFANGGVVTFETGESAASILDGFTLLGGRAHYEGGGVYCLGSSPTIRNCTITHCSVGRNLSGGGGISCFDAAPTITKCRIIDNSSSDVGGGIYCDEGSNPSLAKCVIAYNDARNAGGGIFSTKSSTELTNSIIKGNSTELYGGGIYCHFKSSLALTNCTISDNSAYRGGGLIMGYASTARVTNCTITENSAQSFDGVQVDSGSDGVLYGSIVWGNDGEDLGGDGEAAVAFSNIGGGHVGQGNISANPKFGFYRGFEFVLLPGSPCIDASSGEIRDGISWPYWYPNTQRSDMGAYGGPGAAGWLP